MTRRAPRAAPNAIVVALVTLVLVLGSGWLASSASAAAGPKRPHKLAAKRHAKKRPSLSLRAVQIANHLTGIPYRWGGASPRAGFDCSGLVRYVYGKVGIDLPHHAASQYGHGRRVSRGSLRAGDLVFFSVSATSASTPVAESSSTHPARRDRPLVAALVARQLLRRQAPLRSVEGLAAVVSARRRGTWPPPAFRALPLSPRS